MLLDGQHLSTCHLSTCNQLLRRLTLGVLFTLRQVSYQTICRFPRGYSSIKAPIKARTSLVLCLHIMTHTEEISAKCTQQSMILAYQIFCVPNSWSSQGLHDSLLSSINKHLEKFTMLTDQIIYTLNNYFVCFSM